jgi:hypothetical protein
MKHRIVVCTPLAAVILLGVLWSRGVAQQSEATADVDVRRLVDERAVISAVDGIDSAVDAKDWDTCAAYFADELDIDFTSLVGGSPMRLKSADLVGAWRTNLYAEKKSHHMRSNHQVTIDGDAAEVLSKGYAFNRLERTTGSDLWEVWGDYRHMLTRTPQGWKVTGLTLRVTHARGNEAARTHVPQP